MPEAEYLDGHDVWLRYDQKYSPQEDVQHESRRDKVAQPQRVRRETLAEVSAMDCVASQLAEVGSEQRPPVVVDDHPGIVDYALPCVHYVFAEKRIFSRPEVCSVAAYFVQKILSDEQVAAWIIVHIPSHAACPVSVSEVAGYQYIVVDASTDLREARIA